MHIDPKMPMMNLASQFPVFASKMGKINIEILLPPISEPDMLELAIYLNIDLPPSYKRFLSCTQGFYALNGALQMTNQHPFFHDSSTFDQLSELQKERIKLKGENWPPPSHGMLCFADFFWKADGDQVLFDITQKDENGEYPVYYYDHEWHPARIFKIADSFEQWLNEFPDYEDFNEE